MVNIDYRLIVIAIIVVVLIGGNSFFALKSFTTQDALREAAAKNKILEDKVSKHEEKVASFQNSIDSLTTKVAAYEALRTDVQEETSARVDSIFKLNNEQLKNYFATRYGLPL